MLNVMNDMTDPESAYNENKGVNEPRLSTGMIPIKWDETKNDGKGNWVVCSEDDEDWYNYDDSKEWANIMLSDGTYKDGNVLEGQEVQESELGSMYVWIPRYAYQIKSEKNIDVTFLKGSSNRDEAGNTYAKESADVDTKTTKIVHPGFTLGGTELTGIWVAKFEASGTDQNGNAVGNASAESGSQKYAPDTTTIVKSLPNVISWRHITIGESEYRSIRIATDDKEKFGLEGASSHLIKNSEWGAVAYLCYSQYGTVPRINACGTLVPDSHWYDYYTGQGPKNSNSDSGGTYTYDGTRGYSTTLGMQASTTGNITGVYDMSGGAWERVAAYLDNGNGSLNTYGKSSSNSSIKYFESGKLNEIYASLWDCYQVSDEEKNNKIEVEGQGTKTQGQIWTWSEANRAVEYQEARRRITEETFNKMAEHKGIGVNEMATGFSFYAQFPATEKNATPWGWSKTAEDAVAGRTTYGYAWDGDLVLIGHASIPFVGRGGICHNGTGAGVLYSHATYGGAYYGSGFRPVLVL